MKKLIVLAAIATLAGCGSKPADETSTTETTTETTSTETVLIATGRRMRA